jgi:23S rRNA (guanine745-N1)-methyltransferase
MTDVPPALATVVPLLACPVCGDGLELGERVLRCPAGHSFDLARQGYAGLLAGGSAGTGDDAAMVEARAAFLGAGHYAPLAGLLAELAADLTPDPGGLVVEAGAGTGTYLAAVLDRLPGAPGLALDLSRFALRRAARAHPRMAAAATDLWRGLPLRDGAAAALLDVFAPRNPPEFRRVLRPDGVLLVVTPGPGHLAELTGPLALLGVQPGKEEALSAALAPGFAPVVTRTLDLRLHLTPADAETLILMGPSAYHLDRDGLRARVAALGDPIEVTAAFTVSGFRPA